MKRRTSWALVALTAVGCATPVGVRTADPAAVRRTLTASAVATNTPSAASLQVMLRLGLAERFDADPEQTLATLHELTMAELQLDRLFALAEYSFLHAEALARSCGSAGAVRRAGAPARLRRARHPERACTTSRWYYSAAAIYAYAYLFGEHEDALREPLDSRVRTAADIYNLAWTYVLVTRSGEIEPRSVSFPFHLGVFDLTLESRWLRYADRELTDFEPAARLAVRGLRNRYRTAGIGAPFVARPAPVPDVSVPLSSARLAENLHVPVTIFVRIERPLEGLRTGRLRGQVEIYTETDRSTTRIGGREIPLEYETTAALAYSLERSTVWDFEISGYLRGDLLPVDEGLRMLAPYRPGRIPLVLVHGTASSPGRWAEMFNELSSDPAIRSGYQFWMFMYTSGNPVLYSASLLRASLRATLAEVDPEGRDPALRRMVIVGHSQGGLLTKLQVISSGTRFWDARFDRPIEALEIRDDTRQLLSDVAFFEPLPFVERVIFISTPHRGSFLSGGLLGRIASSLFRAPDQLLGLGLDLAASGVGVMESAVDLARQGIDAMQGDRDAQARREFTRVESSVENMDPRSVFIQTLQGVPVPPSVHAHSIIPVKGGPPALGKDDGVVAYSSAHIAEAESELVVYRASHSTQSDPETIQEVRRILLEHLDSAGERARPGVADPHDPAAAAGGPAVLP